MKLFEGVKTMNTVIWNLFDHFDVQKGIREKGGVIDTELGLEDVEYWKSHPDEFPPELKKKTVFLWNTLEVEEGFRRITMMFWLIDEVATYHLIV